MPPGRARVTGFTRRGARLPRCGGPHYAGLQGGRTLSIDGVEP
jgi:hypothetical protein